MICRTAKVRGGHRSTPVVALLTGYLMMLSATLPAQTTTVYKTVDANGVVSYSDTRPAGDEAVEALDIEVREPELTESAQEQLEAIRETTDRMVADRQQREQHRAEMRQQQARSGTQQDPPAPVYGGYRDSTGSYPVYYPYPVYRPGGGRPRPEHPIARPPLRPPAQLPHAGPGHDYPASLVRRHYSPQVRAAFEK